MIVTSLIGANHRLDILSGAICELLLVNIVYLLVKSFEYTVYFIAMVYCVAFGCNSNICSSENINFFPFSDRANSVGR